MRAFFHKNEHIPTLHWWGERGEEEGEEGVEEKGREDGEGVEKGQWRGGRMRVGEEGRRKEKEGVVWLSDWKDDFASDTKPLQLVRDVEERGTGERGVEAFEEVDGRVGGGIG